MAITQNNSRRSKSILLSCQLLQRWAEHAMGPAYEWRNGKHKSYTRGCTGALVNTKTARNRVSTSTRWHFTFGPRCHNNETRAPIANLPNSAQLHGTRTITPSYIWVCGVVWACGEGQTDTQTGRNTHRHTDARDQYISHRLRLRFAQNVINETIKSA